MRSMYLASLHLDFPLGLSNSLPGCENPVAVLFKALMKPLLSMPPDPARRASLCPGVKAVFPLVQNLNETPVPLRMYGMHRTQCDHVRSDLLPREAYVKHGFGEGA